MPNEKDQALLANARRSVKNELAARRKAQRERLQTFWNDCYYLLDAYARDCIPDQYEATGTVFNHETALANVRKKLRRCQSQTRDGFLSWAARMLTKEKGFHLVASALKRFDLDVSDWVDGAKLRHKRYADFPEHCKDGDLYRVNMGTEEPIVWTIPEQYWQFVQKLWPVSLKQKPDGYFIAKQIAGQTIPVHRLILNCGQGDTVQSTSGNFLDWTSLYVRPLNNSGIYEGRNTSWNKEANRPNTVQEEFESRFQPYTTLEAYGTNQDNTERFVLPEPVPVNNDLAEKTTRWGKVVSTAWLDPITPAERDLQDATERYTPRVKPSVRMQAAAKALTTLGWD